MARKNPPRLVFSPLSERIYVVTRYTVRQGTEGEYLVAHEKYDVTAEFHGIREKYDFTPIPDAAETTQ